ncbi:MAG: hypothetical protein ACTSPI_08510, partial [Candidatus Heimdallarchaeaceae archaeon]
MFNMNGLSQDQKDSLLRSIVSVIEKETGKSPLSRQASAEVSDEVKERIFSSLFNGPNGLKRVAFAMQKPLKTRLDYVAVGRKILLPDELPQGEPPLYDKDIPEFAAVVVGAHGAPPIVEASQQIKRIMFPTFPITIDETINWEEIQVRRYPAFDRAKERAAISSAIAEDLNVFAVLEKAAEVGPNETLTGNRVSRAILADAKGIIGSNQLIAGAIIMNPLQYADIEKWQSDELDQVSLNTITETGMFGSILGVKLIVSTRIPVGTVY